MSILTVYPDAGDPGTTTIEGVVARRPVDESWATISAGAGNYTDSINDFGSGIYIKASATTNQWYALHRLIFLFDTSSLGAAATISAAVLSLCGTAKVDGLSITPNIDIYPSTPASNTTLANADYAQVGTTSMTGTSPITYAAFNAAGYNDFTFNSTGIGNISKTAISKFGARNANYDVSGTTPTWTVNAASSLISAAADTAGTTSDPKLVITYTSTSIKTINALAVASVKTINGVAIASVKTFGGLA